LTVKQQRYDDTRLFHSLRKFGSFDSAKITHGVRKRWENSSAAGSDFGFQQSLSQNLICFQLYLDT